VATTPAPSPGILSSLSPALWERPPLAVCIAALVAWAVAPALPYLDDSYIVLHAAQVIRTGQDTAYGASPLVGITSPAYLALVVVIEACGLAGQGALQVAGALGLFTWLVGAWTLTGVAAVRGSMRLVLPVAYVSGRRPRDRG